MESLSPFASNTIINHGGGNSGDPFSKSGSSGHKGGSGGDAFAGNYSKHHSDANARSPFSVKDKKRVAPVKVEEGLWPKKMRMY